MQFRLRFVKEVEHVEMLSEYKRPANVLVGNGPPRKRVMSTLLRALQRWVAESAVCRDSDARLSRLTGGRI